MNEFLTWENKNVISSSMELMKMISCTIYVIMDYQCVATNCFLDNLFI
jgi:hypothetical protein